ncbi:MAG TPA: protein kinase [Gammaproteobacteria bacterium]|nr:protein kinase [Gammaproteobacteria bacterium]
MSEDDSDKTRVKKTSPSVSSSEDVTRLAHNTPSTSSETADDKTRIPAHAAPRKISEEEVVEEDKTRIAPASGSGSVPSNAQDLKQQQLRQQIRQKQLRQLKQEKLAQEMIKQGKLRPPPSPQTSAQSVHSQAPEQEPQSDVTQFNPTALPRSQKDRANVSQSQSGEVNDGLLNASTRFDSNGSIILKERFVLEKVLGSGGMGVVYKAKDLLKVEAQDRDPYVAIKVLSEEFKSHPKAFISLQRESRKSQRIAHPNIVNVYDFDRDGDTVFMTMEFLDGNSLDQLIRQYKATGLPTDDAWDIINGLIAALSHAHAEKIIHSDFKPGNIFVTRKGATKVFDFGIARAVAKVEQHDESPEDKTLFDAGNLGALTPAYASLEMLEGEEPDIRDDLYALGCVAYALFTGRHPYNRLPANEAEKQGLTPKRISNISKFQWQAIKKAISFRRENRFESVERFAAALTPKIKSSNSLLVAIVVLLSISIASYFVFFNESPDAFSEYDIRNELELKIKIDYLRDDLISLVKSATFTDPWQDAVWKDVTDLQTLMKGENTWINQQKELIYQLYLKQVSAAITAARYGEAKLLIKNARRYSDDTAHLDAQLNKIVSAIEDGRRRKEQQKKKTDTTKRSQQEKRRIVQQKKQTQAKRVELFDLALENVNAQTRCQGRLKMRNVETAVNKLRDLDSVRYNRLKSKIVNSLASCIVQTGKAFPERALEARKHALRIFKSNKVLLGIKIKERDPCDISLAGLGSSKRASCKDKIKAAGSGPMLVVVPGNSKFKAFAIGKYEVSVRELNKFCKVSTVCEQIKGDADLPASNISFKVAKAYMKWLSRQSKQKYRLPTKNEWLYAAKSKRRKLDANRNCKLSTRGIEKGGKLVRTSIGKQNSWGLVNYVGNVQEWVYDKGRRLVAVGGSFTQPMDTCSITTSNMHSGSADVSTGLRVVRELRTGS